MQMPQKQSHYRKTRPSEQRTSSETIKNGHPGSCYLAIFPNPSPSSSLTKKALKGLQNKSRHERIYAPIVEHERELFLITDRTDFLARSVFVVPGEASVPLIEAGKP